ncbi:MAG: flagellar biosynthetic protein FliQ [Eubacteriales bacterium]
MTINQISDLFMEGIIVVLKLGGPMLVLSMIVGIALSIFQAVTQVHEQTLGFIFKLSVVLGYVFINGGWMMRSLVEFTQKIFVMMRGG